MTRVIAGDALGSPSPSPSIDATANAPAARAPLPVDAVGLARTIAVATAAWRLLPQVDTMGSTNQAMRDQRWPAGDLAQPAGAVAIRIDALGPSVVALRRRPEAVDHALVIDDPAWLAAGSS